MLGMLLGALLGIGQAQAGTTYDLNDAGLILDLPGWEVAGWSDWDLRAARRDGPAALAVWYTDWQPEITEEVVRLNAIHYTGRLERQERAKNARVEELTVTEIGGRPTGLITVRFNFDRVGARGVLFGADFAADGKTIHVAVYGAAEVEGKLKAARDQLLAQLKQTKPPAAVDPGPLTAAFGKVTLPPGWRAPLPSEAKGVAELVQSAGEVKPESCAQAIRPDPPDGASLLLLCPRAWRFGVLDEASFPDLEPQLRAKLFGKGADKVPPGRLLPLPDRAAALIAPNLSGHALRVALVPYTDGILDVKILAPKGGGDRAEADIQKVIAGIAWSGPDNGAPAYTTGESLMHGLSYNPAHPLKVLCVLLGLGSAAGLLWRLRGRERPEVT